MHIPIDYPTLRIIWWFLLGVLIISFAVTDGFDLGIGILLPGVAHTDAERRVVLKSVEAVWEGNQIWLVLAAGAIFAAWPDLYAVAFSGFYFAMLLTLLALILRPVGFKYRNKIDNPHWRAVWDICLFINGFVPTLIFGVAVGNVLQGVPFYFDTSLRSFYEGSFWGLLNPFAILCGLLAVCMLVMHGGIFLSIKTVDAVQQRAYRYARLFAFFTLILFAIAGSWIVKYIPGYLLSSGMTLDAPSNPLHKTVITQIGAWMINYERYPLACLAPIAGFGGAILAILLITFRWFKLAFCMSTLSITGIIATVGVSMFPFIMPSSLIPNMSLMVWDTSSSALTLFIMLLATIVFIPIIALYTSWVYYVMRGKVIEEK